MGIANPDAMMAKMQEDEYVLKDPMLKLGSGIIAYRHSLRVFVVFFFVISLLTLPILYIYRNGDSILPIHDTQYGHYSLGNMGFESVQCSNVPITMAKLQFNCPYGNITTIVSQGLGINTADQKIQDACVRNDTLFSNGFCSSLIDETAFNKKLNESCYGKSGCTIDVGLTSGLI